MKKCISIVSAILLLNLLFPLNVSAGIMDDFMQKRDSIRYKGEILQYKVKSFDVNEQLAKYPDKIEVNIPDDFQVEPFTFDDYNVGHIPQIGEFKGYSEEQFNNSKQEMLALFNNKKSDLQNKYNHNKSNIESKMNNSIHKYERNKKDLQNDYNNSVEMLQSLFNQKSNDLGNDLEKKENKIKKQMEENYHNNIEKVKDIMNENKVDYWGESDKKVQNAKEKYNRISKEVQEDTQHINQLMENFKKVKAETEQRMKEYKTKYENYDHEAESKELFDQVRVDKPAGLDSIINNIKNKVNKAHANFSQSF